jgi:HK97 family phage portal protein
MTASHVLATSAGNRELRAANPALPWGETTVPPPPGFGGGTSQQSAAQIAAVYGSVGLLADSVSTLPCRVVDSPVLKNAKELAPSALIQQPFSEMSRIDWFVQYVWSLALRGEFIGLIIERDRLLYASQIKPLDIDRTEVRRNREGNIEYRYQGKLLKTDDVFHVKYQSWPGMIRGLSPIDVLKTTFGLAVAQDKYGESYFRNSANPMGAIEVPGSLGPDETKAMLRSWLSSHQGVNRANLPAVLTDGAKFNPISITPEDSQFLESRAFSAAQIAGTIFRIPPHMIGLVDRTTSWGTGVEQQERGYVTNTLQGYLGRAEEALTALHPPGQYVNFNIEHRVRGDTLQRSQSASLLMLAGAIVADEARAMFDMPALPNGEGQKLYVPINTELLQAAIAQIQASEAAANQPPVEQQQVDPFGGQK